MGTAEPAGSVRQQHLLRAAYDYVAEHGLVDMSLRPLAEAIGSSPRVLLFLFGSKDGLVQALLAMARADQLAMLDELTTGPTSGLADTGAQVWRWLSSAEHRPLLTLWAEGYAHSLLNPAGPWGPFAQHTVDDWLAVLAAAQSPDRRRSTAGRAERTLLLAVLRGALLDLLATGDTARTTAAVRAHLDTLPS